MAICILVLEEEKMAYQFWEKLISTSASITNFQLIEPSNLPKNFAKNAENASQISDLPKKVEIKDVKLLNPKISRKDRQQKMSLWLIPFGFIAGLTFSGMTNLNTFSDLGFNKSLEPFIGGILGMFSGWIGSFFAAGSIDSNQKDLKGLLKKNKEGFWLILLETPLETEPPWQIIKEINPIEVVNLNVI